MLLLIKMLDELLSRTGLTFSELSSLVGKLRLLGRPPLLEDKEAFRVWLMALAGTYRGLLAETETGKDTALMGFVSGLGNVRWEPTYQLFGLLSKEGAKPDDAEAIVLAGTWEGIDAARVSMVVYTLAAIVGLLRKW